MSDVVASYVYRKNMFYNQTSLKGFSTCIQQNTVELTTMKAVMKKKLQLPLKLISQNQSVTWWLISQNWSVTLTEEEDLQVEVNFDEPNYLALN